jgi:hypothetical protein
VCSVVVAAVLSVTGISDWRLKAAAAAGAAIATFAGGILQIQLSTAMDERRRDRAARAQSIFMPGGKPPLVRDLTGPLTTGVHAAARRVTGERVPPYVPRDVDPALRQALGGSGFVLLSGTAAAGKTRAGYEAIRAVLPGHVFIAPKGTDDIAAAMKAARAERDCVLWLDSLQGYLGAGAVTSGSIAELLAGKGHHRVVLATLRAAEESRLIVMAGSLSGGQLMREGQAVLALVDHRIVIDRLFSSDERARAMALASQDSRLAAALGHVDRYGVAEYLSSGPQLQTEWDNAWERGTHPRGAALVAAAVDCRLAGFAAPLPRALLDELEQEYLDQHGGMLLRPEPLAAAWAWATELRSSGSSPLWPAGPDTFDVFDYLVDVRAREPAQPVPDRTVRASLELAGPADALAIGATAWYQDRPELAVAGFRRAYSELSRTEGADAPATLASRSDLAVTLHALGRLPDAEAEYRAILAGRSTTLGAEHPDTLASRNNLANVLQAQRRLAEAEAEYRAVLDIRNRTLGGEHPSTLLIRNNLGVVLIHLGRPAEAEAELEPVVELRAKLLGSDHPHTVISRRNLETARRKRSGG